MTGLADVTAMNDILVESGRSERLRGRISQMQGIDRGSMSWKVLRVNTVQSPSLAKDVHQDNCVNSGPYSWVVSLKEDRQLQTTCRNSCQIANHHRLSIHRIYIDYGIIRTHPIVNVPAQGPTSAFSWGQEHLARVLDVFLDTNCIHKGR